MKTYLLLLALLMAGCKGQLVVWNGMELIGAAIVAVLLIIAGVALLISYISEKIKSKKSNP